MNEGQSEELKKLLTTLNELEESVDLQALTFRGMQVWPLVKMKLYWSLGLHVSPSVTLSKGKALSYISHGLRDLAWFLGSLRHLKRSDFLFSSATANRRFRIENRFFDYYLDPIATELTQEGSRILFADLNPPDFPYRERCPQYSPSLKLNLARKAAFFISRIRSTSPVQAALEPQISEVMRILAEKGYAVAPSVMSQIYRQVLMEHEYSRFFRQILKRVRPKAVFAICYYAKWGETFACHQLGVKFVDVQHGAQGYPHPAYSLWEHRYNVLPDLYWNWNLSDKQNIERWGGKAFYGGNPFSRLLKSRPTLLDSYVPRLKALNTENKLGVAVTLQPGADFSYLGRLKECPEFFFYVKLHPVTSAEEVASVKKLLEMSGATNYDISVTSASPIQAVLLASKIHLTIDSYTVSEASELGLHTVCLGAHSVFLHKTFIEAGTAHYLPDFGRFAQFANELLSQRKISVEHDFEPLQKLQSLI